MNFRREGWFEEGRLVEGSLKGDDYDWKNMSFEFKEGVGTGTFNTSEYYFKGSIMNTAFEKNSWHGHCVLAFNDG